MLAQIHPQHNLSISKHDQINHDAPGLEGLAAYTAANTYCLTVTPS
jgi:hypothetical protein